MRRQGALVALAVLVLVACNGDDDAGPATVPTSPATAAPTTTSEPSSTTTTTTSSTSTTAPAPDETTTTAAQTTTTPVATTGSTTPTTSDPDVDAEVQARIDVIERAEASWAAVRRLYEDPFDDTLAEALGEFFTGNQLDGFGNVLDQFRDGNFRSIPREGSPEIYEADPRSVSVNLDTGSATVQVCHVNTAIIVETGGNPDGTDRIARDEITEEIVELGLELEDGVWKVSTARAPDAEVATCP